LPTLDDEQTAKARAMQRAWIGYRDTTCNFYYDKIRGTMAGFMIAECVAAKPRGAPCCLDFLAGFK
jgi:uncharacterized protein YecT (DUF1311 family)